ncbi:MAG: ATP-binding protein [Pseudomonadota bacterium]
MQKLNKLLDEHMYQRLTAHAPMNIAVINKDFNIIMANRQFRDTFGEWNGKKCYDVQKGRHDPCGECLAASTFADGKKRKSEETGRDRDGNTTIYSVHYFPLKDDDGSIPYIVEMSIDVTGYRRVESRLRLLFDNVPCYITVVDRDFRVVEANRLFEKKFGRKNSKYCYELYKRSSEPCGDCPALKVFETKKIHRSLQTGIDADGNESHYVVTAAPIIVDDKSVSRVIEMSIDVSEVLYLKERLVQAEREKIENERLAAVGQTVAGLSHGIKNVLMGLEGGIYVVNSGLNRGDDELVKKGWDMLENNITKVSTFVKEFLSFARGTEPEIEMVDPAAIAREVANLFMDKMKQSGISLKTNFSSSMKEALMDPEGIHTCLANLISNAVDACLMSDNANLEVAFSCYEKDDTIYYVVEDNGCGMDYEIKKKIFTSFFTTKGSGHGTGLGLLFTRKIINQHGGRINVDSTLSSGSVFTLELPRNRLPRPKPLKD